jgi:hypothetical protein
VRTNGLALTSPVLATSETFMRFLEARNYCLGYFDSDDGDYDPSRECFNLEVEGTTSDAQGGIEPSKR